MTQSQYSRPRGTGPCFYLVCMDLQSGKWKSRNESVKRMQTERDPEKGLFQSADIGLQYKWDRYRQQENDTDPGNVYVSNTKELLDARNISL